MSVAEAVAAAAAAGAEEAAQAGEVGTSIYHPPRHPTQFEPSFLGLVAPYDVASILPVLSLNSV
jgi:hypothetical protein